MRYYDAAGKLLHGSFDDAAASPLERPLRFEFEGNRVDVVAAAGGPFGTAKILIDGKKPSAFHELYAMTRSTGTPGTWVARRPLRDPRRRRRGRGLGDDDPPREQRLELLRVRSEGIRDRARREGRQQGDVHLELRPPDHRAQDHLVRLGQESGGGAARLQGQWSVYGMVPDEWKPKEIADQAKENVYTLAQGLPNGKHVLEIIPNGDGDLPVRYLVVYQPLPPAESAPSAAK